ncbi:hypothetical protein ALQ08_200093 [Pseudomonas syringae pv. delphinii]|uniref:Uncharacterized protein n=2 Tax=Pseudomonas syringae group genomosp. 3 TaxID=251701 RepID=A0A0P9PHR9_9PSED|nr:hypothetical protein ALO72_200127 [Pseudomonas syringae pv. delphinii]RMP07242.1 hypothetical protein ALQ28_00004 [Pseudomonas syringae pv. delphinii]RMP20054.1 hypothetical protein ALQ27_02911 [Pseudomonas syringae pv. delphinii]RMQ16027.1 hypothetical protein ALQ08_200093 [Pseudomonas syringae pv. delphinii]
MAYWHPLNEPLAPGKGMDTIVIRYFEQIKDLATGTMSVSPLGKETYESISEALMPGSGTHKIFCIKKFTGVANYRWYVEGVAQLTTTGVVPAEYSVTLSKIFITVPEEYLQQTLKKTGASLNRVIQFGTIVEVDYGFIQTIGREDGALRTNKRYCDTLQKGEMHKRRLAIVVGANRGVCQVVPVTSDSPGIADKTSFQLSRPTLDQLTFWGSSGKDSWAICQMVESVSVSRILPPVTEYQARGQTRRGRNTHYTLRLAEAEKALLRNSLLHSIGVTDYQQTKTKLSETREQLQELIAAATDLEAANGRIAALEAERKELLLYQEVAVDWGKGFGEGQLEAAVGDLRELYEMMATEGSPEKFTA